MNNERPTIEEIIPFIQQALPDMDFSNIRITAGTRLHEDLGLDSMHMISVAVLLAEEYQLSFNPLKTPKTIADFIKCIEYR